MGSKQTVCRPTPATPRSSGTREAVFSSKQTVCRPTPATTSGTSRSGVQSILETNGVQTDTCNQLGALTLETIDLLETNGVQTDTCNP